MPAVTSASLSKAFKDHDVEWIFTELLSWGVPRNREKINLQISGKPITVEVVRELSGFKILKMVTSWKPQPFELRELDKKLSKIVPERLLYIVSDDQIFWVWPKRAASGAATIEISQHTSESMPAYLAQKLAGIGFSESDIRNGVTIGQVSSKVRGQFDSSKVTKKFYEQFKMQHANLAQSIRGIESAEIRSEYASTILNRLMFIYFLQKKQFLNNDVDYLNTCLLKLSQLKKENKFYSFYKHLLTALFFEKLGKNQAIIEDPNILDILGVVPYINGGIFQRNHIEGEFEIEIEDDYFKGLFQFFDSYVWHLDTRSTGVENEINPEVIGYIFEQYINAEATTGQKENGAYYTPHDVTSYMTEYTVVTKYLDKMQELGFSPLDLIAADPIRYIKADNLVGFDLKSGSWSMLPSSIKPSINYQGNGPDILEYDSSIQLPGESLEEVTSRRKRVNLLLDTLENAQSITIDTLITNNLDCLRLVRDFHDTVVSPETLEGFWEAVSSITVIDPTCGSGAFLFAALEHLEAIYFSLIEAGRQAQGSSPIYLALAETQPNERYFIRRHCALRNLFGTDLMPGAVETAKLRIFLSLAACLDNVQEMKPLPDLDLNLKCGNLVIGIYDTTDAQRLAFSDLTFGKEADAIEDGVGEMQDLYSSFIEASEVELADSFEAKSNFLSKATELNNLVNSALFRALGEGVTSKENWLKTRRPFNWFIEFPNIQTSGGFDVVVGNPPYINLRKKNPFQEDELKAFEQYATSKADDFYAICYERSLQLLKEDGRHSFIVMMSLGFSQRFRSLTDVMSKKCTGQWWSTFGKDPSGLFAGVKVRNTIVIMSQEGGLHQTNHKIITTEQRGQLFPTINYHSTTRTTDGTLIRAGLLEPVVRELILKDRPTAQSDKKVYVKVTAAYWFPVMYHEPKILDSKFQISNKPPRTLVVPLRAGEDKGIAFALLGSRLGYLTWASIGDDFDSDAKQADRMLGIVHELSQSPKLKALAAKILEESYNHVYVNNQLSGYYPNIRWPALLEHTQPFERAVLQHMGCSELEVELDSWYLSAMKSTKPASNNTFFSKKEVSDYLNWS